MMFHEEHEILHRIEQKVDRLMAAQDDINAAVTALDSFLSDLSAAVQSIQAELAAAGTPPDTTALNSVIAQLPAAQAAVDALVTPAAGPVTP
jgi:outer membrane murein-binding lipoprotein Lpp